jgi:hypothetical protein
MGKVIISRWARALHLARGNIRSCFRKVCPKVYCKYRTLDKIPKKSNGANYEYFII